MAGSATLRTEPSMKESDDAQTDMTSVHVGEGRRIGGS
jgi:hypothetical protein